MLTALGIVLAASPAQAQDPFSTEAMVAPTATGRLLSDSPRSDCQFEPLAQRPLALADVVARLTVAPDTFHLGLLLLRHGGYDSS